MKKTKKGPVTSLSDQDRKVLSKYTKFHTNFIESNTARTDPLEGSAFKGRKD